jgi:hypothetical protein
MPAGSRGSALAHSLTRRKYGLSRYIFPFIWQPNSVAIAECAALALRTVDDAAALR